jgi:hypothetical protein
MRFGWRKMCEKERLAMFYFWREVGRRMNIVDLPNDYAVFEQFNVNYERKHFRHTESNHRVGGATREMFASWFPAILRPLVRRVIYALLDDALIVAFGFPRPSRAMRAVVLGALKLRAIVIRYLPRRTRPILRTEMKHLTYPEGYVIGELGPPMQVATTQSE